MELATQGPPFDILAKFGAERPRFHNPDDDEGLRWLELAALLAPLTLDQEVENVDEAGDLLALITPGSSRLEGELGPERPADSPGLRW